MSLSRRLASECIGTALLLAIVVGSGIMGQRLAGGNEGIALLANSLATGAGLTALILVFGPVSGAHFNPVVTLADASQGGMSLRHASVYIAVQFVGALAGVITANVMFGEPALATSDHPRAGGTQLFSEFVATFGLMAVIWGCSRQRSNAVPFP